MTEYYTMESVREFIVNKYDVRPSRENTVPLPSWNRYPCENIEVCTRRKIRECAGYVAIFVNTETVRWLYLEIRFFREKQRAFIRVDSLQMQKLFELGIIVDEQVLQKEAF